MGTTLTEVADLFLSSISDYKLDTIYYNSGSIVLNTYIEPWLLKAINEFSSVCDQDLSYTVLSGNTDGYFTETLTMENKIILSQHMELFWLQKGIQDFRSLNLVIQDHDFKTHSPAQNTRARTENYNSKREELSKRLAEYTYDKNDWDSWNLQVFS